MSDIKKIKILHDLKNNFNVSDDVIQDLINQIADSKYKDNINRFFRGYSIEDNFKYLFAALPWIKEVNGLDQEQLPLKSKNKYQVADFSVLYETSKYIDKPILFEVKSVSGKKETLELMVKQVHAIGNYATSTSNNFLFAIYWEKFQMWTVNTIQNFKESNKKYKINFFSAIKNDLSIIIGDMTFLIDNHLIRKTIIDPTLRDSSIYSQHEKYGTILENYVSTNMINWHKLTVIEAAIIDSFIEMVQFKVEQKDDKLVLFEKSKYAFYMPKLSSLILKHLAIFNIDLKSSTNGMSNPVVSRIFIIEFMKKLSIKTSYIIPAERTDTSDRLYEEAFGGTWILNNYKNMSGKFSS